MSKNLAGFLIELGENPQKLEEFRGNPAVTMHRAKLSGSEQEAVRSGDGQRIRRALCPDSGIRPVWVQETALLHVRSAA